MLNTTSLTSEVLLVEVPAGILGVIEEELAGGELASVHLFITPHLLY